MAFKAFKKMRLATGDQVVEDDFNILQDNVEQAFSQLLNKDQLDTRVIKNVLLKPDITNKIPHTLGRALQGFIIVRNHGQYSHLIRDLQDTNPSPHLLLYLTTEILLTVDLLVF